MRALTSGHAFILLLLYVGSLLDCIDYGRPAVTGRSLFRRYAQGWWPGISYGLPSLDWRVRSWCPTLTNCLYMNSIESRQGKRST